MPSIKAGWKNTKFLVMSQANDMQYLHTENIKHYLKKLKKIQITGRICHILDRRTRCHYHKDIRSSYRITLINNTAVKTEQLLWEETDKLIGNAEGRAIPSAGRWGV